MAVYDEEMFINLLMANPILYNKNDPLHLDKSLIYRIWQDIGNQCGLSSMKKARAKYEYLKQFLRKKKNECWRTDVPPHPIIEKLKFLEPHLIRKRPARGLFSAISHQASGYSGQSGEEGEETLMGDDPCGSEDLQRIPHHNPLAGNHLPPIQTPSPLSSPPEGSEEGLAMPQNLPKWGRQGALPTETSDPMESAFNLLAKVMESVSEGMSHTAPTPEKAYATCVHDIFLTKTSTLESSNDKYLYFLKVMKAINSDDD